MHCEHPGEAPAARPYSAGQDPHTSPHRSPGAHAAGIKSTLHPGSCSPPGWGPGPLHSGWGSCPSQWLWSPAPPTPGNHTTHIALLQQKDARTRSPCPLPGSHVSHGPRAAFPPGSPLPSVSPLSLARDSPTHCPWQVDSRAVWGPLPELQAPGQSSTPFRASDVPPSSKSCLAHTAQHRAEVQCG